MSKVKNVHPTPGGGVMPPQDNPVGVGREEGYSESKALNSSTLDNKIFYMYREVIITLLISYPQDDVSHFLFGTTNDAGLDKMFSKNGEIDQSTFDKVVWFSYNAKNYANQNYSDVFLRTYTPNFLNTIDIDDGIPFNLDVASESISLILCRYLFTIFKTIQARGLENNSQKGGMNKQPPEDTPGISSIPFMSFFSGLQPKHSAKVPTGGNPLQTFMEKTRTWISQLARSLYSRGATASAASATTPPIATHTHTTDTIVENCHQIEAMFDSTLDFDDDGNPLIQKGQPQNATTYNTILQQNIDREQPDTTDRIAELTTNVYTALQQKQTNPSRRQCSRLVQKQQKEAEAAEAEQAASAAEQVRREKARLEFVIKAKEQMDAALRAAGYDYIGTQVIAAKYFSKDIGKGRIDTTDATFITYLAKTSCSITNGVKKMLQTRIINNKIAVNGFFARLGLLQRSINADIMRKITSDGDGDGDDDDDDDEEDDDKVTGKKKKSGRKGGGQIGGSVLLLPKGVHPIGVRAALEGIGAANQCFKGVGAIKNIPRIRCYICGELWLPDQKTMECEHIFCVGLAAQYFGLLRSSDFSDEQRLVLSILYAWAHRCCNQLKSNISFMQFKTPPAQGFQFHEHNARELLNNIYGNKKYDCNSVNKSIQKTFNNKARFTNDRTIVLSKYCRPLISEINHVRTRVFFGNANLFSFMSILKIATTALVLFTENNKALAIKSKDMVALLKLFNDELEVSVAGSSQKVRKAKKGGGKSLQIGGGLEDYTPNDTNLTDAYVKNWLALMQWTIELHRDLPESQQEEEEEEEEEAGGNPPSSQQSEEDMRENPYDPNPIPVYLLGRDLDNEHEDEDEDEEDEVIVDKSSDIPPSPPFNIMDVFPRDFPQGNRDNFDNDIFVFKLLAHTHEMNTHTILKALVVDHLGNIPADLMTAIATITVSFLSQDRLAMRKKHASVLQLLLLIGVNIGPHAQHVQKTIDEHYLGSYVDISQQVCNQPLTHDETILFHRTCLILCPGVVPPLTHQMGDIQSEDQTQTAAKFMMEMHEDLFLFLTQCPQITAKYPAEFIAKIKTPSTLNSSDPNIDRTFKFETDDDRTRVASRPPAIADANVVKERIYRLCDMVVSFFYFPPPLSPVAFPNFQVTLTDAKDELLTNLSGYVLQAGTQHDPVKAKSMLEGMFTPESNEESAANHSQLERLERLRRIVRRCADKILEIPADSVFDNIELCMYMIVEPFLKAAFVQILGVDESEGDGSDSSSQPSHSVGVPDSSSQDSPREEEMGGIQHNESNASVGDDSYASVRFETSPEHPGVFDNGLGGESPGQFSDKDYTGTPHPGYKTPPQQWDERVKTFMIFLTQDIVLIDTEIFQQNNDENVMETWITRICIVWNRIIHDDLEVKFSGDLVHQHDGGSSKNKSSIRTRRKLGRNHRRTQHTNKRKHKRSSSKHTTIKHRKSYRKHHRTIKRHKNSRRRRN